LVGASALCNSAVAQEVRVIEARSTVQAHPEQNVSIVPTEKLLGGGAHAKWQGAGNLLTSTAPTGVTGWSGSAKDHGISDPAELVVYALALSDPANQFDVVVSEVTSAVAAHPTAVAQAPQGYVMASGGCRANWETSPSSAGNMLTASFPASNNTWECRAKDHSYSSPASITAYVVAIKPRDPAAPLPAIRIDQATSSSGPHPEVNVSAAQSNYLVTGGGARSDVDYSPGGAEGQLLTRSAPLTDPTGKPVGWIAAAKDHLVSSPGTVTAFVVSLDLGPVQPQSNADAIRNWIDALPHLAIEPRLPGSWGAVPGLPEGINGQQRTGGRFVNDEAELVILKSFSDIMWPGALVQGASIAGNNFAPILLPRSSGRIRLDASFVGDPDSYFRDLPVFGAGEANDARNIMLAQIDARDVAGASNVIFATAGTVREGMVKLGVAYKSAANSLNVNASLNSSFNENTVFAKYTQRFYKVVFDPNANLDSPFFGDSVTLDQVKRYASPQNPPLYVSEVTFGRTLVLQLTARKSKTDLEAAVNAVFGSTSGSLQGNFKETLDSSRVEVLSVGATGDLTASTLTSAMNVSTVSEALQKYITNGAAFSPSNPGAPIAFVMRYMGGSGGMGNRVYDPAIAQMVTDESPEIRLSASEFCRTGIQLWRGSPGGGWKDTGLVAKSKDKLRFIPDNSTRVRSLRVGEPGTGTPPRGWNQPIPGPADFQFPIGNRPPFSLIGRIGDRQNIGKDVTGGDRLSSIGTGDGRSDSFYIGEGTEIVVGKKAYGPNQDQSYDNVGHVYLGINDSEAATLGFPAYRWSVNVCMTPSVY
jgi:hypothetical protein